MNDPTKPPVANPPVPKLKPEQLELMQLVHRCVQNARKRIIDGRAREALAIFEHELAREISDRTPRLEDKQNAPKK